MAADMGTSEAVSARSERPRSALEAMHPAFRRSGRTNALRPGTAVLVLGLILGVALLGCGGSHRGMQRMHAQPQPVQGSLDEIPVSEFYQLNCASCHGERRQGAFGPPLTPNALTASDDFYFSVIADGSPGTAMPAWSALGLEEDEIATLVRFLRTDP